MLFPAILLFFLFLLLSAFFSSSETAFVAANPYRVDYLEKKGSKSAKLVKKMLRRVDDLLATILIGNTLVNTAAASTATFIFVSFMPSNKNQAVLLATVVTTLLILIFSEITPKTYAAHNPVKLSFLFIQPVRFFIAIFYPLVKIFALLTRLIFPSQRKMAGRYSSFNEEEIKVLFSMGVKGMSSIRKKMISEVLEIGSRPIREIMVPRPKVEAIEIESSPVQILDLIRTAGFSRFPVYRGHLDNIKGIIHAKDVIPYLDDNKEINIKNLLRKPLFVPESASLENVILQMQESTSQLVFVVDEFGNMEGIVTLEDIIEEIVGEIQDEYDAKREKLIVKADENIYIVRGDAPIKEVNQEVPIDIPVKWEYTTLAGFFLNEFGKIPKDGDVLEYKGQRFEVKKMKKRHIELIKIVLSPKNKDENNHKK